MEDYIMQTQLGAGSPSFNRAMARLAIPIVLQNLVTTAVSSADVIMLGFVNQNALAAGSLASQIMFVLSLVYAGISSGVIMLAAQYWGKQDTATIERIMGIGMQLSILVSADSEFFLLIYEYFPGILMYHAYHRTCSVCHRCQWFCPDLKHPLKCRIYLRTLRSSKAWDYRGCPGNQHFQGD